MIKPPDSWGSSYGGVAFSTSGDGDLRSHPRNREGYASLVGVSSRWATVNQVHGNEVQCVSVPGVAGDADGLITENADLPLAVFTADCLGIAVLSERSAGVVHAGWRGLAAGVIERLLDETRSGGAELIAAAVGPSIGPCCFEVGPEVAKRFGHHVAETTWGTTSVDLWAAAEERLASVGRVWVARSCTQCSDEFFSHRRNATLDRQATLTWRSVRD